MKRLEIWSRYVHLQYFTQFVPRVWALEHYTKLSGFENGYIRERTHRSAFKTKDVAGSVHISYSLFLCERLQFANL